MLEPELNPPTTNVASRTSRGPAADALGSIEKNGINVIPEHERHSSPLNIFAIMFGSSITFSTIILGWVPIALGLSWWAAFWAILLGAIVGAALLAPLSLLSPQTGTNNPIGSGAHFGVVGRIVGSALGLIISVVFTGLAVWTGGDAMVAGGAKLLGTPDTTLMRLLGYLILTVLVSIIAVYGHANMVFVQKVMIPTSGVLMVIGFIAFSRDFSWSYAGGQLALGSFWPTWFAGAIPTALAVMGYGLAIGDWTRYISPLRYSNRQIAGATVLGGVVGQGVPIMFGAFTAAVFIDPTVDYIPGLVAASSTWYVVAILWIAIGAGAAQGTVNMYSTGLDLSSIFPSLKRVPATLIVASISLVLVIAGVLFSTLIDTLVTFLDLLSVGFACFAVITAIGFWNHRGQYDADALQVFARRETGGRYWFTGGLNYRALTAFSLGTLFGLLSVNTAWFVGPFVELFGGIGLGFIVGSAVASISYVALLIAFPEDNEAYASGTRRLGSRVN